MSRNRKMQKELLSDPVEKGLISLTRQSLLQQNRDKNEKLTEQEWMRLLQLAEQHAVISLFYDVLEQEKLSKAARDWLETISRKIAQQSYHLLEVTHQVVEALAKEGISAAVLKGVAAAACYPVPELRKSGDVDLILQNKETLPRAEHILSQMGFAAKKEQHGSHHLAMINRTGIEVELHTILAEPFEQAVSDTFLQKCTVEAGKQICRKNIMGYELPVLAESYHAFELLLHMLQHFLHSGFGLKLLCDWVCFWNQKLPEEEADRYRMLVEESGLCAFSDMVTSVCIYYLGLSADSGIYSRIKLLPKDDCKLFLEDILEGGEFGASKKGRMIVLGGTHFWDYIREFHYQMHQNFPKAGKIVICWPVLWGITLGRFLANNRRIRKVSTWEILRKSKKRSRMVKKLGLFP